MRERGEKEREEREGEASDECQLKISPFYFFLESPMFRRRRFSPAPYLELFPASSRLTTEYKTALSLPGPLGALPGRRARPRHPLPAVAARGKEKEKREEREEERQPRRRLKRSRGEKTHLSPSLFLLSLKINSIGNRPRRRRLPLRGRFPSRAQGRARREGVGAGASVKILFFNIFLSPLVILSRLRRAKKGKKLFFFRSVSLSHLETPPHQNRSSTSSAF